MFYLMFYLSGNQFSVEHTQGITQEILSWLIPAMREDTLRLVNYALRKLAHFVEYAVLAGLLFRAFRADSVLRWRSSWAIASGMIVIAWAVMDETHQTFNAFRHGSIQDALLDSAGGLLMLLAIALHHYLLIKSSPR